ncbi:MULTISPECIES: MCE family protein [Prauserella salsuginis group]|uniref:Phospholipid/cholesterol/gamma-HCH transport system substrate-binding protein n=2 Tax=Prauserella salsuginis group TaxID=2893672 RepID=A0A839XQH5_9PSEU|nr:MULTISPECIES: MCE family protein [Prauserella salsuginis group]MBB3662175.1 phospholipid/cholesterol/gamma-HCH transport system substrate-binding protein [Prauserella sediminis]MCR3719866.1 phospholipid/cholesterol/gamma-HCH transport system substrate-binding protein [Prauserella flava]MCR3736591.1 phospholipid/cholesterol/gamma-HCH transport system substrate-binding protein [Prauserella salsuginis]
MKSFQKRNPIPIAITGIIVIVLGIVAALNTEDLPLIGGGTTYQAEFSEAAGLKPDDEVRVAGVKVGNVSDVELDGDRVNVSFKVRDAWLGDRTSATIKIKTLLGQKYVALDPLGENPLDPGSTIPRERTTAPYDVLEAFRDLSGTVDEVDTDQLAQSFDVLSETFSDTPDEMSGALDGLSKLSNTIAKRDQQLKSLLKNTKQISGTLAGRDEQLVKLMEDGSSLLGELQRRKQAITTMLQGSQELSTQLRGLVADNNEQIGPVLNKLDRLTGMLQRNEESLSEGIRQFAPFVRVFNNTIGNGRWFDNYICGFLLPSVGPVNEEGCNVK